MKSGRLLLPLSVALALALPSFAQQTVARLSRADVTHSENGSTRHPNSSLHLRDSATSRATAEALFAKSDLHRARALANVALRHNADDAEALFVRMELAGIDNDYAATLEAALRLCEVGVSAPADARVRLAAVRVREAAANTAEFRRAIPRIQALLHDAPDTSPELRLALLEAARDGAPGLDAYILARAAGVVTDWRIVGPLGSHPLLDSERPAISPADDLSLSSYAGRAVENFQFSDGWIRLPDYFSRRGVFYAAAQFASLTAQRQQLRIESGGLLEIYVDGQRVLRSDAGHVREQASFDVTAGPHRVLVKFIGSATPLRIAIFPDRTPGRAPLRAKLSEQEATYLLAAEHYADGEFLSATRQIDADESAGPSVGLQFLRAQAVNSTQGAAKSWPQLDFEPQLVADAGAWAQQVEEHPSCAALEGAVAFYGIHDMPQQRAAAQRRLDGCASESLAYAESLARDGEHQASVEALRKLLAGAPLNRKARLMLVRELQLAGDDDGAQRAAADWLRIAPNAPNYHRLAAASADLADAQPAGSGADFFQPYRRDAEALARQAAAEQSSAATVLLDDQVAIARPDGSVSLYIHRARKLSARAEDYAVPPSIPRGAQVLTFRILHSDGTSTPVNPSRDGEAGPALQPADVIDTEYVVHFTGDGGIPEHAEAFQFVFGSFDEPVLEARFVVLTPADHGDGGVVIATGQPPAMAASVRNGMLARIWEKSARDGSAADLGLAIVRVVEQENGWSVPSNAEHQRRIETIHPGPRPQDS